MTVLYLILLLKSNKMFVAVAVLQNIVARLLFFAESSLFSFSQFCLLLQWEFIFLPNFSSLKKIKGKEMARYFSHLLFSFLYQSWALTCYICFVFLRHNITIIYLHFILCIRCKVFLFRYRVQNSLTSIQLKSIGLWKFQ